MKDEDKEETAITVVDVADEDPTESPCFERVMHNIDSVIHHAIADALDRWAPDDARDDGDVGTDDQLEVLMGAYGALSTHVARIEHLLRDVVPPEGFQEIRDDAMAIAQKPETCDDCGGVITHEEPPKGEAS
jgi:hypothetical protein